MRHLSTTRKPPQPIAKLGNCPPKAEVTSSNLVGRANDFKALPALHLASSNEGKHQGNTDAWPVWAPIGQGVLTKFLRQAEGAPAAPVASCQRPSRPLPCACRSMGPTMTR